MKKFFAFSFALLLILTFLLVGGQRRYTTVSAQNGRTGQNLGPSQPMPGDPQLAAMLKRLTNRSADGLTQRRKADGTLGLDLGDGFQNVMLARTGTDGQPIVACVSSLAEANDFLGRDLETGAPIYSTRTDTESTAELAARHGMPEAEFLFYQKLIADAAAQRAASPNTATLNIVNADGAGEGFNDATAATPEGGNTGTTRGQQRLNLFQFAAGIWGAFLDTSIPIDISSKFDPLAPCTTQGGVLGAAGTTQLFSDFSDAPAPFTWYHVALANKLSGQDLFPGGPEISARFNSDVDNGCLGAGSRFYYGLNNSTPANRVNLLIVLLHEMGHGLGFSTFVDGASGANPLDQTDGFQLHMFDRTTGKFWSDMTNAERQASAVNPGNVVWDGPNVRIASGFMTAGRDAQGRVQLYTPSTFQQGSSISHFDIADTPNLLMEPNINLGLSLDLDLTKQEMRDMGWYRDTTADLVPDTITGATIGNGPAVIGTQATVRWTNNGGFNRNVTVELSLDGGSTYPTALATNIANAGNLAFTVPNSPASTARIRIREAGFVDPVGITPNFTIGNTAINRTRFDFDGDGKADLVVFRPSAGTWFLLNSTSGFSATQFGASTDVLAPADFDGDGKTDIAVFRPSTGGWFWINSGNNTVGSAQFGAAGDIPVPGDYDGDNRADLTVFRPADGVWYRIGSANGSFSATQFGASGDKPTPGDFDGDGKFDIAVYRPAAGAWYRLNSSNGSFAAVSFGTSEDLPTPADYDGDGKADVSVFRPSTGIWFRLNSSNGAFVGVGFGSNGDRPAPADFDGDGKADIGVFRPTDGVWYLLNSGSGFTAAQFGANGDLPAPNAFVYN
jgi:hypothetical protein